MTAGAAGAARDFAREPIETKGRSMSIGSKFVGLLAAAAVSCGFAGAAADPPPPPPAPAVGEVPEVGAEATGGVAPLTVPPAAVPVASPIGGGAAARCECPPRGYPVPRRAKPRRRDDDCRICDPNAPAAAISRVPPFGAALHSVMGAQVSAGDAAQLVLYSYDFHPGKEQLNCRGMLRLLQMAPKVARMPFPLVIEPTLVDPALDEARRAFVVAELAALEPSIPAGQVVVGLPPSRGLDGVDATLIHTRVLGLTERGTPGIEGLQDESATGIAAPQE